MLSREHKVFIQQLLLDAGRIGCQVYDKENVMQTETSTVAFSLDNVMLQSIREECLRNSIPTLWALTDAIYFVAILLADSTLWILGPLCSHPPTPEEYEQARKKLNVSAKELEVAHNRASTVCQIAATISYLLTGIVHTKNRIFEMNTLFADMYIPQWIKHHVAATLENRFPYEREQQWLDDMAQGRLTYDETYLQTRAAEPSVYTIGTFAQTTEKQAEYLYVSAIVLACRAIINGGVSPFNAYELEETYLQQMASAESASKMKSIFIEAMRVFSSEVRRAKVDRSRAGLISRCKVYVDKAMYEKITVQSIADAIGVSANHLSSLFVKSEGITLTEYIHHKRLDRSRELLRYSTMSISEISEQLMFSSQIHFCKLLKQTYDRTPS